MDKFYEGAGSLFAEAYDAFCPSSATQVATMSAWRANSTAACSR